MLIKITDFFSTVICGVGYKGYVRNMTDLRLVLYHGVGNNNSPCFRYLSDEVPVNIFESHIEYLSNSYEILSLNEALDPTLRGKKLSNKGKPICSISFDDGLKSVYDIAFPILRSKSIPVTVFLNTAVIGNHSMNWQHLVNYLISEFDVKETAAIFNRFKSENLPMAPSDPFGIQDWYKSNYENNYKNELLSKVISYIGSSISKIANEQNIYLNWDDIDEMESYDFTFCSHTANHAPLSRFLDTDYIIDEIKDAYDVLSEHGKNIDYVSFPFGMKVDYGERAIECAFSVGHKYVFEVGSGVNELDSVMASKLFARVSLGSVSCKKSAMFSAIEFRPKLKSVIKRYI